MDWQPAPTVGAAAGATVKPLQEPAEPAQRSTHSSAVAASALPHAQKRKVSPTDGEAGGGPAKQQDRSGDAACIDLIDDVVLAASVRVVFKLRTAPTRGLVRWKACLTPSGPPRSWSAPPPCVHACVVLLSRIRIRKNRPTFRSPGRSRALLHHQHRCSD